MALRFIAYALIVMAANAAVLNNGRYRVELKPDGSIEIGDGTIRRGFTPEFTILASAGDPELTYSRSKEEAYVVPAWKARQGSGRTMDMFQAAVAEMVRPSAPAKADAKGFRWMMATRSGSLEAALELPASGDPILRFRFTPKSDGWYSVGYTGAPQVAPGDVESLWQPLVWQERRFPRVSYLSVERMCSLPASIVAAAGASVAVVADPSEVPFRIPSFEDSRFGVLLRNAAGQAQPALFAPVLGHPGKNAVRLDQTEPWRYGSHPRPNIPTGPPSNMKAGVPFSFAMRLVVRQGGWYPMFRHIAENLYGFRDYRENTSGSLNDTIENFIAFAMNDVHSGWVEDLRGFDYTTDVAGTVKVVSALHPLSVALITDSPDVFRRRALPVMEYLLSREKYLFSVRTDITDQNPSHYLRGPAAEVSELAALYAMSGGRSTVLRHYAEVLKDKPRALNLLMVSEGGSWQNELALYRLTGDRDHLDRAQAGANKYIRERIETLPTDFADVHVETGGQFWTDFTAKWIDLFELYEETKDPRHLQAAASGAKHYATYSWLAPSIPDADVTINPNNQVGVHGYLKGVKQTTPMRAPEQRVPAWRVSMNGLIPEASTTYSLNPAVFLAHHAAYMLRIGQATNDTFLKAVARSAIVGRYSNYPGYDINGEFTTLYERPDYPQSPLIDLSYNNIYYNHVWPHIALLFDFLISDVTTRSGGQISFPSRYAQGYAYLQSKVYGDRPGTFYGNPGVQLWMPAKMLQIDNPQLNYVSGYDGKSLYIAFSNQSARPVTARVRLNVNVVPYSVRDTYKVRTWQGGRAGPVSTMSDGQISVTVPASGLTAVAVDGLQIAPQFQHEALSKGSPLSEKSYSETAASFGKVAGMLLSFGQANTSAYVWTSATEDQIRSAKLHYRLGNGPWAALEDTRYPYEFRVPAVGAETFSYWIEAAAMAGGEQMKSEIVELRK